VLCEAASETGRSDAGLEFSGSSCTEATFNRPEEDDSISGVTYRGFEDSPAVDDPTGRMAETCDVLAAPVAPGIVNEAD
jgi:hypothetical protein